MPETPTPAYDIVYWAWKAFGRAFDVWMEGLPPEHEALHADYYPGQIDLFFAAHPDGWARHPDDPLAPAGDA